MCRTGKEVDRCVEQERRWTGVQCVEQERRWTGVQCVEQVSW